MSNQIDLVKKGPSRAIPKIEWHGWTTGTEFGWLEQKIRSAKYVQTGDIAEGARSYATPEAAVAAKLRAVAKKLKDDDRCGLELGDVETLRVHVATTKLASKNVGAVRSTMSSE